MKTFQQRILKKILLRITKFDSGIRILKFPFQKNFEFWILLFLILLLDPNKVLLNYPVEFHKNQTSKKKYLENKKKKS